MIQTSWVATRGFNEIFAHAGLTPGQFGALQCLAEQDGLTQAEIARQLSMRPQSLGEVISSLLDRALVQRNGPPGRGRRSELSLTEQGRTALQQAWPEVRAFNAPDAVGLTSDEAATLTRLLRTVRQTLSNQPETPNHDH